jgi:hypothetical protein
MSSPSAKSQHQATVLGRFPGASATQLARLKSILASIKAELVSSIAATCPGYGESCKDLALAFTDCRANADIGFCPPFRVSSDCRTQAAAIIHEIAHHIVCLISPAIEVTKKVKRDVEREGKKETVEEEVKEKTGDVYRHFPEFATVTAAQALQNPDSIAVLCLDVSSKGGCLDCSGIMQTDAKKWDAIKKHLKSEHTAPASEPKDVQRQCAACAEEDTSRLIQISCTHGEVSVLVWRRVSLGTA